MNRYEVTWFVRTTYKNYWGVKTINAPTEEKATELVRMQVWLRQFNDLPISSVFIENVVKTKVFYHL